MKPFFFVGNKRSGTSLMVDLVSLHPKMHCFLEKDWAWILAQMRNGKYMDVCGYQFDVARSLWRTMLAHEERILAIYFNNTPQTCRDMFYLSARIDVGDKWPNLEWIGDKMPVQSTDPFVYNAIDEIFAGQARYIHIVRHPRDVLGSMKMLREATRLIPPWWHGSDDSILDLWAEHEFRVIQMKERFPICTIRYEDLVSDPTGTMRKVYQFFDVPADGGILTSAARMVRTGRAHVGIVRSPRAREIMQIYGYTDS